MWQLFNDSGLVANFHIGAGSRKEEVEAIRNSRNQPRSTQRLSGSAISPAWAEFDHQRRLAVYSTQMYMSNVRIIANLCLSNLFDRFPKLKIVSAESGIGWVPFLLESLDYQFDEMVTKDDEINYTKHRPSQILPRAHLRDVLVREERPGSLIQYIGREERARRDRHPAPDLPLPEPAGALRSRARRLGR